MNKYKNRGNILEIRFDDGVEYLQKLSYELVMANYVSEFIDFHKYYPSMLNSGDKLRNALEVIFRRMPPKFSFKWYYVQVMFYDITRVLFPKIVEYLPDMIHDDWLGSLSYEINNRDHMVHQPMVAYISNELLEMKIPHLGNRSLIDGIFDKINLFDDNRYDYIRHYLEALGGVSPRIEKRSGEEEDQNKYDKIILKQIIQLTTTIASLYHDIGYPWQMVKKLSNQLDGSTNSVKTMVFDITDFSDQYQDRMLFLPFKGYSVCGGLSNDFNKMINAVADKTHSLYSSLCLLSLKDSIAQFPQKPSMYNFCVEWAAMGILMHDMLKIYLEKDDKAISKKPVYPFLRLSFSKDPISTLLVLSDFLQEFERPRAIFNVKGDKVTVEYDSNCESCCLSIDGNTLKIKFICDKIDKYYEANLKKECNKLFDRYYGFVDLSDIGIYEVNVEVKEDEASK